MQTKTPWRRPSPGPGSAGTPLRGKRLHRRVWGCAAFWHRAWSSLWAHLFPLATGRAPTWLHGHLLLQEGSSVSRGCLAVTKWDFASSGTPGGPVAVTVPGWAPKEDRAHIPGTQTTCMLHLGTSRLSGHMGTTKLKSLVVIRSQSWPHIPF